MAANKKAAFPRVPAHKEKAALNRQEHFNPDGQIGQQRSCSTLHKTSTLGESHQDRPYFFTFACDDVRYKRKDRPDVWITPDKVNGEMFVGYPCVSFIPGSQGMEEPIQKGDFVIDIDTGEMACSAAIKILDWFQDIYGVESDQWRVYLSGKKGVHLELPAEILGAGAGHVLLTLGYKRLAKDIEGELQIQLDTSMYTRGVPKPFRQPNVMRDTGTCKRQIQHDDLYEITTEEEYRLACSEPGPVWQPEDISENAALAEKFRFYIAEAAKQQNIIKNAPVLSPDDIDRLIGNTPPCMKMLSKLTVFNKKTYNDIAIQLTAYAVTSQRSEADFLAGCSAFIENYPSSSLTTLEKRYENCRARYRTMSANGNQHSCGGVLALKLPGFDCNECESKGTGPAPTVPVMSDEDIRNTPSMSLVITKDVIDPGGLITLGMKALSVPGMVDIPQYNLPVVLTVLANAIAGKVTLMRTWPNVYNIKCGETSSGKTSSDDAMCEAIINAGGVNFYGGTGFASGPALLRGLVDNPKTMLVIDECTEMFRRYDKGDANSDGKRDALMEIYSASGRVLKKLYADSRNEIVIEYPCLSISGNATSDIFNAIKQDDFDSGVIQRFDFFTYEGPTPKRGIDGTGVNPYLDEFAARVIEIRNAQPEGGNLFGMNGRCMPTPLGITPEGYKVLSAWSDEVTDKQNAQVTGGDKGIVSRTFDLAKKYAMVHSIATRPLTAIFDPIDVIDIEYGKSVAVMLSGWKVNVLRGKVSSGDFHQKCQTFMDAQAAAQKTGRRPTLKLMQHRRPAMLNWREKELNEVIDTLVKRGEIAVDDSKEPTAYYRPK